jgi:hypothetical protein
VIGTRNRAIHTPENTEVMNLMRKNLFVSSMLLGVATLLGSPAAFAGSNNWVGSWKLNAAKSKFSSDAVARAQTLKFESTPAGIKLTSEGTDAQGKAMHGQYTSNFDGKEVAWTGNPTADMASPKRIDDSSYENVWKLAGKQTMKSLVVVSSDNKTLTVTQTPTGAQGEATSSVAVYDRQ